MKRDKQICHVCEKRVERLSEASRDHKTPKKYGGTNNPENLALAHKWCNKEKGHKIFRAEQHGTGWVVVSPDGDIASDEYETHVEAFEIAQAMNGDKMYMDDNYGSKGAYEQGSDIIIIRRASDNPM